MNIKSATADQVKEAVDFVRKAFLQHGYSDEPVSYTHLDVYKRQAITSMPIKLRKAVLGMT